MSLLSFRRKTRNAAIYRAAPAGLALRATRKYAPPMRRAFLSASHARIQREVRRR